MVTVTDRSGGPRERSECGPGGCGEGLGEHRLTASHVSVADEQARREGEESSGEEGTADQRYLALALVLITTFLGVEAAVAILSGSLALLADAGHMLTDAAAIAAAIVAARLARRPARGTWTFGLKRAEILSAAGNGITLLLIAALIGYEAIRRLIDPPPVEGLPVLAVATAGVAVNLGVTWVLAKANRESLNVEGAFQHILTDLYAFIGTAGAGLAIYLTGFARADPIASLLVVVLMLRAARSLLRDSGRILLQSAPQHVDLEELRQHLLDCPRVRDVHDLHAWTLTSELPVVSVHVVVADECFTSGQTGQVLDCLQACLAGHFDVEHSTFQLEPAGHDSHEHATHD